VTAPPPAEGVRLTWEQIPASVRAQIEARLGNPVVQAISQATGFTPGVAARCRTADGRRVFIKAAGLEPNPGVPATHRREAEIVAVLPVSAPIPRLLWWLDDHETGWVVLAYEEIDGYPPAQPWLADELNRVLEALNTLSSALTPSPLPLGKVGSAAEIFTHRVAGWGKLKDQQPSRLDSLDSWSARHLDTLIALEADAPAAVTGDTLLHLDIRADNLLLSVDKVWFVDWPLVCVGAAWVDVVLFAPSVHMQGGPLPEMVIAAHEACQRADPASVTACIAALAGFFTYQSLQPPPPGLPTVRAFQAAQGVVTREWLARRLGLN
jgi:aminoglycoside phosphotransferase (APT) family kinase protein